MLTSDGIGLAVMFPEYSDVPVVEEKSQAKRTSDVNNSGRDEKNGEDEEEEEDDKKDRAEKIRSKMYRKRRFVLNELLETEKKYIDDLAEIVEGFMKEVLKGNIKKPDTLLGKEAMVFGNVGQILDWHSKSFVHELEKNLSNPRQLAKIFTKSERKFDMYIKYCENKPKSEDLVYEHLKYFESVRESLDQKFQLADMLIKPVQRIMKYKLLFKDILKYTEGAGDDVKEIQKALEVMYVIPKAANDMMNVSRLQGFEGKITAQGRLLRQDDLLVSEVPTSKNITKTEKLNFQNRKVFLFEQIIIFSETEKVKNPLQHPRYFYRNSIKINELSLKSDVEDSDIIFILINKSTNNRKRFYCKSISNGAKKNWVCKIQPLLDMQTDFLKALQSPQDYLKDDKRTSRNSLLESSTDSVQNKENSSKIKSKQKSFKKLFVRQSSILKDQTSLKSPDNEALKNKGSEEARTPSVVVENPLSKWSVLRKLKLNTSPMSSPDNITDEIDDPSKPTFHASIEDLLSTKKSGDRKNSMASTISSNPRDSKDEDNILRREHDISLKPKTAGVMWNSFRLLFKRPSITQIKSTEQKEESCGSNTSIEEPKAPSFIEDLKNIVGIENSRVTFSCVIHSPQPLTEQNEEANQINDENVIDNDGNTNDKKTHIKWFDPSNKNIASDCNRSLQNTQIDKESIQCKLTLNSMKKDLSGVYKCHVTNDFGAADSEAILKYCPEVKSKPRLKVNTTLNEELSAKLECLTSSLSSSSLFQSKIKRNFQSSEQLFKECDVFKKNFMEVSIINRGKNLKTVKTYLSLKEKKTMVGKFYSKFFKSKETVVNEFSIATSIENVSIVRALELYQMEHGYIILYPHIKGDRLFEYIVNLLEHGKQHEMSRSLILKFARQLFDGVSYLHDRHIAHLAIKPENLLVETSEVPQLKIINLSHAVKLEILGQDQVEKFDGDAEFCPPEILQHQPVSLSSDVWNCGVVMFAMMTGFSPFYKCDLLKTCQAVQNLCWPVDLISQHHTKEFLASIFSMPPHHRPSAKICLQKCHNLSSLTPTSPFNTSPTLLREFLKRRYNY